MGDDEGELMRYRSSVTTFAKALLCETACQPIELMEMFQAKSQSGAQLPGEALCALIAEADLKFVKAAQATIPGEDSKEILDYIDRYYSAYKTAHVLPVLGKRVAWIFPWMAEVAICALDDIGR
jgi:hypothetical protein